MPAHTKSSLMVGLGETRPELHEAFEALREADVDILTVGQYLRPSLKHLPLERYYHPDEFAEMKVEALALGFKHVESAPMVRSSYHARDQVPGAELKRLRRQATLDADGRVDPARGLIREVPPGVSAKQGRPRRAMRRDTGPCHDDQVTSVDPRQSVEFEPVALRRRRRRIDPAVIGVGRGRRGPALAAVLKPWGGGTTEPAADRGRRRRRRPPMPPRRRPRTIGRSRPPSSPPARPWPGAISRAVVGAP